MKNEIVFVVNSLGEQIDVTNDASGELLSGSVLASEVPDDPWEQRQFWLHRAAQNLNFQQFLVYSKWAEATDAVNQSSLYRFYAHLMSDGTKHLWLSVEFWIPKDENEKANKKLMRAFQKKWGLDETVMDEDGDHTQYICDIDVWNMPLPEVLMRAVMMRREIRAKRDTLGEIVNNVM